MPIDEKTPLTLNLTIADINVVLGSLSAQPYDKVAGLIASVQQQAAAQLQALQAPAAKQDELPLA